MGGTVDTVTMDLSAPGAAEKIVASRPDVLFHLAAIVSGEAEADFEKGYRINLDGTRNLLEAIRRVGGGEAFALDLLAEDGLGDELVDGLVERRAPERRRHVAAVAHRLLHARQGALVGLLDLGHLDAYGNLQYTVDFRSVYATVLDRWLGAPSASVLGGSFGNQAFLPAAS